MTYKGWAKGKRIELENALPFPPGQPVSVPVEPRPGDSPLGSPAGMLEALRAVPHLNEADVDDLENAIERGKLAVRGSGVFDPQP